MTEAATAAVETRVDEQECATAEIMEVADATVFASDDVRARALEMIENGGIVFIRDAGFRLTDQERALVADSSRMLPTRKERESQTGRPTVIYDPERGRFELTRIPRSVRVELKALLDRYSEWTSTLLGQLLPSYAPALARDRVTFRPCLRSKVQGMHIDSSYGHPTEGRGMLRVFCNIDVADRPRRWQVGEPFEPLVRRYLAEARSTRKATPASLAAGILTALGVLKGRRTDYDALMADLRRLIKGDVEYQRIAPRRIVEFPPGSAWIAITDLVLHGALAGQNSLDQTFYLPPEAMKAPERSSLRILERLTGRPLA
jgi:hypothetical protein